MYKIFIDGSEGTTGLRIRERLSCRDDITLLRLPEEKRKDIDARRTMLNESDISILCLPDAAAVEAVSLIENDSVRVIDASTAHRTVSGWLYGFPELSEEIADALPTASRVAVPGCHASGFIALITPLIRAGLLPSDALLSCHSLTGYSGGGKKMIADYESDARSPLLDAPRQYGLTQTHKHLREMKAIPHLSKEPLFCPIVADFYAGMLVTVPLHREQLSGGIGDVRAVYAAQYRSDIVSYVPAPDEAGFLSAGALTGKDRMEISVFGNEERILLVARYDNLGKGASGAAVECLNIMTGADPTTGLVL